MRRLRPGGTIALSKPSRKVTPWYGPTRGFSSTRDVALDSLDNIFAYGNDDDLGWWTRLIHQLTAQHSRSRPDRDDFLEICATRSELRFRRDVLFV